MRLRVAFVFVLVAACKPPPPETSVPLSCVVGSARVCTCSGSDSGVQLCLEDGSDFGACDCTLRFSSALCAGVTAPQQEHQCVAKLPTCVLYPPFLTPNHAALNGVSVEHGGDRVSSDGAPYQALFLLESDSADTALLIVDGGPDRAAGAFVAERASVAATFTMDGEHTLSAECISNDGAISYSRSIVVPVDTAPPPIAITAPAPGAHLGPALDANPEAPGQQIAVCVASAATDAQELCAAIGTATPGCISPFDSDGSCVLIDCPGGAAFDIHVSLRDAAGNRSLGVVGGVTCAAVTPSVQIVDPVASLESDPDTRILAAASVHARKDKDASALGAQYLVRACTDAAGGQAVLRTRFGAETPRDLASAALELATPADGCPAAHAYVARFETTVPESRENQAGALLTATTLEVSVTDLSGESGTSPAVAVWVDSEPPIIQPWYPAPICGYITPPSGGVSTATIDMSFAISASAASLTVTGPSGPTSYSPAGLANPVSFFENVIFADGSNELRVDASEPSGNTGVYPAPGDSCTVQVNNAPIVTFLAPFEVWSSAMFSMQNDTNAGAAGWQGTLTARVNTDVADVTVTFYRDAVVLGVVPCTVGGSVCVATLPVDLVDGPSATITAVTSNVTGRGVGTGSLGPRVIDTVAPAAWAPSGVTVEIADRRQTSFRLHFLSPEDEPLGAIKSYEVHSLALPLLTAAPPPDCDAATESGPRVDYTGTPRAPGLEEQIVARDLLIERFYCFSVKAIDSAGNTGAATLVGPIRAELKVTTLTPDLVRPTVSSSWLDVNGDGLSDLLVGSYEDNRAFVYFGKQGGWADDDPPDLLFTGPSGVAFGYMITALGDLDGDGLGEIGVPAPVEGPGRVYVWKGRTSWPAALDYTTADMIVALSVADEPLYVFNDFGYPLVPLGDFDGDGANDFAIGHYGYDWNDALGGGVGGTDVIFGVKPPEMLPSQVVLPQDLGTRALAIREVGGPRYEFSWYALTGLGHYYPGAGTTLIGGQWIELDNEDSAYSFAGESPREASWGYDRRRHALNESPGDQAYFIKSAGPWLGTGSILTFQYRDAGNPLLFRAISSSPSTGPFTGIVTTFTMPGTSEYTGVMWTSGFDGTAGTASILGQTTPDLVFTSANDSGIQPRLYFVSGETWASLAGQSVDLGTQADVIWDVPDTIPFTSYIMSNATLRDSNGDGYADLSFAEYTWGGEGDPPGRVIVIW